MKTKPNFTYKEFIQKISNVHIKAKDNLDRKSPKTLKSHHSNIPIFSQHQHSQSFLKTNTALQTQELRNKNQTFCPITADVKKNKSNQNCYQNDPNISLKCTTNKLKLKNNNSQNQNLKNFPQKYVQQTKAKMVSGKNSNLKQPLKQGKNYQNQSNNNNNGKNIRHMESCETFYKNFNENEEEDETQNPSFNHNKSLNLKLKSKKQSNSSIDGKLKLLSKGNKTDRNLDRISTQYDFRQKSKLQRVNTQYDRFSPSFYHQQQSVDQLSNFIDLQSSSLHNQSNSLFNDIVAKTSRAKHSFDNNCQEINNFSSRISKLNEKSQQHIYNKFISNISQILFQIAKIEDQNQLLEHKIRYIEYLQCLKQLKLIKSDYEPYSLPKNEVDLVKELWEELIAGHNTNHFIVIIAIILKITPLQEIESHTNQQLQNYIYLQRKYEHFRYTRLELTKPKQYSQRQCMEYYNFPFKPTMSKKSQLILASKSKEKQASNSTRKKFHINNVNGKQNNSFQCNQSLNLSNCQQSNFPEASKSIHSQMDNSNVSFVQNQSISQLMSVPHSHNQSSFQQNSSTSSKKRVSPLGSKRSQILYKEGKKKSLEKNKCHDKSTVDYQYEKNIQELTFKPKLKIKKKNDNSLQQRTAQYVSPRFVLDEEKTINRMIRGRVEKQVKQTTISKGLPYNDKVIQKLKRQKFQQVIREHHQSRLKFSNPHQVSNCCFINFQGQQVNKSIESQIFCQQQERKFVDNHNKCSSQVQNLENLMDLSFQELTNTPNNQKQSSKYQQFGFNDEDKCSINYFGGGNYESLFGSKPQQHSLAKKKLPQSANIDQQQFQEHRTPNEYFILDIYFEQDRSEKLFVKKDSTLEELNAEAESFTKKYKLPSQMQSKLKQQLMIAMMSHDIQKIEEHAEEQEYSLIM